MTDKIRVLIADDHLIVRKGIQFLLSTEDDIDVIGEVADGVEAVAQAQVLITAEDTTGSLSDKLARIGAQLVLSILPSWVKGYLTPRPQNAALASYCRKLTKEDGEIDWGLPATEIWRRSPSRLREARSSSRPMAPTWGF